LSLKGTDIEIFVFEKYRDLDIFFAILILNSTKKVENMNKVHVL